ncbi:MAG TPA: pyridoxamine 5'-phosphate oxidase family protein [Stellaceae bacterium]|nr:pyridoxamine 5'-phosphate oxidase family protein [Stellaceae bacterium]
MNRRQQIRMTEAEIAAFLREQDKAALATIGEDGFPHVVAMGYVVEDGAIMMTSYAKAQKVLNIRRNPKVGLMVETGGAYAELRGVMIRGPCEVIEGEAAVKAAFVTMRAARGGSSNPAALASAGKRVVLRLVPEKVTSWDHRKLAGRY